MLREYLKSKVHNAVVTQADLNYIGSITMDPDLYEAADMREGEKVQVLVNENGNRFETYIIKGERGSGTVCLNGPAARQVQVGDHVVVITYCLLTDEEAEVHKPVVVFPNDHNKLD